MNQIKLVERDFDTFFSVPFHCYEANSHFVSLMRSDLRRLLSARRNPLFARHGALTFFTAQRGKQPVGRIVAHIHHESNRLHSLKRGYFGFFDCADERDTARLLLSAAEKWVAQRGCDEIAGNFNLTAMQQLGVVTDGFDRPPYTDMHYNPPHIPKLLEACGYRRFFPMRTWETPVPQSPLDWLLGPSQRSALESNDIRWSRVRRRGFRRTMEQIRGLLNQSFAQNPMFVPLTREEFDFQSKEMMWIVDHRITQLAFRGDQLVGVVLCIPDLNPFVRSTGARFKPRTALDYLRYSVRRRRAVILFLGVKPSQQNEGLCGAMLYRLVGDLRSAGYTHVGGTWISDENPPSLRQVERFASHPLHRLHLFGKRLIQ